MIKEFTKEMLDKLEKANESLKGTPYYHKYCMQCETKVGRKWKYLFWGLPYTSGQIKTVKLTTYIMIEGFRGESYRYVVNHNVKELLGI